MDWSIVATVIAALGGREVLAWLSNRKAYARQIEASAKGEELNVHERQIERYEKRLVERDAKVDAIYAELRESQRKGLEKTEEIGRLKTVFQGAKIQN